ncbi:hypothetical protein B0T24DRAFT_597111 [Lasiosphaeria ovina]|uniref:Uncharacterized protein n=1 Tax=Lasiosphaeria ovina TaxID=92902 RepID=A0AAE0N1D0_9PEZI|nr:hypothetical protein B0T24DRAFT_597111 [Lasiosphaeria ovina]
MLVSKLLLAVFAGVAACQQVTCDSVDCPSTSTSAPLPHPTHSYHCGGTNMTCGGVCGDGKIQRPYEQCDLGPELNGAPNSGCTANCTLAPVCGNGNVEPPEQCDLGAELNGHYNSGCSLSCTCTPICGDGKPEGAEQCDLGELNGQPSSGCSANCTLVPTSVCGDGKREHDEECDAGPDNGAYNSGCSSNCTVCGYCGDGIVDDTEQCDLGWKLNGAPGASCSANCTAVTSPCHGPKCGGGGGGGGQCETCNPSPPFNKCTITTSCIATPPLGLAADQQKYYCACRAGYRGSGLAPTDPRQFRLEFPGQEYRVFVAPGVECDELCSEPFPGPDSCREVPVKAGC